MEVNTQMHAGRTPYFVVGSSTSASPAPTSSPAPSPSAELPVAPKVPTCLDRSQILDATARVLRERGYDGTTIRTIAKQLNCAVGSIYRYFKDKRTLLDAVCQRRFEAVAEHAELRMSLQRTVLMYARTAAEQPEQYRLMYWLNSVGRRQHGEALPAIVRRIVTGWSEILGDQAKAKQLWAQLHGCIMLGLDAEQTVTMLDLPATAGIEMEPEDVVEMAIKAAAEALAVAPESVTA